MKHIYKWVYDGMWEWYCWDKIGGTVPYKAIFCGDIPLHRPYIGLIYGRYLQFRFLKWPLTEVPNNQTWLAVTWENPRTDLSGGFSSHGWFKSSSLGVDGDDLRVRIYRCAWCRLVWWWLIIDVLLRDVLMDGKYFTIFQFGKGKPSISMFFLWAIHLYHGLWCYEMVLTVCELEHGPLK